MPEALIIALLANSGTIVSAVNDIINQVKAKHGGLAEVEGIATDVVKIITDALTAVKTVG